MGFYLDTLSIFKSITALFPMFYPTLSQIKLYLTLFIQFFFYKLSLSANHFTKEQSKIEMDSEFMTNQRIFKANNLSQLWNVTQAALATLLTFCMSAPWTGFRCPEKPMPIQMLLVIAFQYWNCNFCVFLLYDNILLKILLKLNFLVFSCPERLGLLVGQSDVRLSVCWSETFVKNYLCFRE